MFKFILSSLRGLRPDWDDAFLVRNSRQLVISYMVGFVLFLVFFSCVLWCLYSWVF